MSTITTLNDSDEGFVSRGVINTNFTNLNNDKLEVSVASSAYQPKDTTLTALAGLATGPNKLPMSTGTDTFTQIDFKDEDNMSSNSDVSVPSQQSVKAYVDSMASPLDGWITPTGTWTASDANTISVNTNLTTLLQTGDKIKLTNNSVVKYYVVSTTPVFSSPNTTFDVVGEVDLVAGAIVSPFYSRSSSPFGMKDFVDRFKARAFRNTTQSLSIGFNKIQLTSESFDLNSNFDNATNYRYTAPVSGYYQVFGRVSMNGVSTRRVLSAIYKNGTEVFRGADLYTAQDQGTVVSDIIYLAKGDYIELYGFTSVAGSTQLGSSETFMSVQFVSI